VRLSLFPILTAFGLALWLLLQPGAVNAAKASPNAPLVKKRLIFLPFFNQDAKSIYTWVENSISDWIHTAAQQKFNYDKIPESEWQKYLRDKNLPPKALFDVAALSRMGRDLGADGIIFGRFYKGKVQDTLTIEGKILSVIDREILASKETTTPVTTNMLSATEDVAAYLAGRIKDLFVPTDMGALWRNALAPGWGYFYKQRTTWGYVYSGTVGTSFVVASAGMINFLIKRNDYLTYQPEKVVTPSGETALIDPVGAAATFIDLEAKATKARAFAMNSLYVFLAFYSINLIHGYFIPADSGNIKIAGADGGFPDLYFALHYRYRSPGFPAAGFGQSIYGLPEGAEVSLSIRF